MSKFEASLGAIVACLVAPAALAQQPFPLRVPPGAGAPDGIQVAVSYSMAIPLENNHEDTQSAALEKGRRLIYGIAAGECKVLEETIAASCRLERLNVQSNVQRGTRAAERVHVSANAGYRITLK
jgi:hypothetical protein